MFNYLLSLQAGDVLGEVHHRLAAGIVCVCVDDRENEMCLLMIRKDEMGLLMIHQPTNQPTNQTDMRAREGRTHQDGVLCEGGGEEAAGVGEGRGARDELGEEDVVDAGEEAVHLSQSWRGVRGVCVVGWLGGWVGGCFGGGGWFVCAPIKAIGRS